MDTDFVMDEGSGSDAETERASGGVRCLRPMPRVDSRGRGVLVQPGEPAPSQAGAVPGNAARVAAAPEAQHEVCRGAVAAARRAAAMEKFRSAEEIEDAINSERLVPLAGPMSFRNWIVSRAGIGTRHRERVAMCTQKSQFLEEHYGPSVW